MNKSSMEMGKIFVIDRNDMRRMEKEGVLTPQKHGQGKASEYTMNDIDRLFDIKMLLLSGFRVPEMPLFCKTNANSDEILVDQIKICKKRILMMEFILRLKEDMKDLYQLDNSSLKEIDKVNERLHTKKDSQKEMTEIILMYLQLVFSFDFLSKKHNSLKNEKECIQVIKNAYKAVKEIWSYEKIGLTSEDIESIYRDIQDNLVSEDDIKAFANEIVDDYEANTEEALDYVRREYKEKYLVYFDEKTSAVLKKVANDILTFSIDYFMDRESIYYLAQNIVKYVKTLDLKEIL